MNIGEASKASGISAKMIRYYEQSGVIPSAERSESGYRSYGPRDIHRLRFIRHARDMGFAVADIEQLLSLWDDRTRQSADVKRLAQAHIQEMRQRIETLQQMVDTLQTLVGHCAGDDRPDCPILEDLEKPEAPDAAPVHPTGRKARRLGPPAGPKT